jgi:hypothetical protein
MKMRAPELSPAGSGAPSLVHAVVRVSSLQIMPSCSINEQITLRVCPAVTSSLKGFILTTGAEGTVGKKYIKIVTIAFIFDVHSRVTITESVLPPTSLSKIKPC